MNTTIVKDKPFSIKEMLSRTRITMPDRPRTTVVPPCDTEDTVRKVVEYTDYPVRTVSGRQLIRRVEKILMPNGHYRYPETYIDMTPGFTLAPKDWDKDRVKGYEMELKLSKQNNKNMETKKIKQVPSINQIGGRNPNIPAPVIVSRGTKSQGYGRTISRPMRTNSCTIGAGEPINWNEVYS